MAGDLTFMMGDFAAVLPADRRYCRNHMWCARTAERWRFGFTAYAVRLIEEVYLLDWEISENDTVKQGQLIGRAETPDRTTDVVAPIAGAVVGINRELLVDPSPLVLDGYSAGWLIEMDGDTGPTLTASEYFHYLEQELPAQGGA